MENIKAETVIFSKFDFKDEKKNFIEETEMIFTN